MRTLDGQVASRATPRFRGTWGKVIDALAEQRPHVPYRDSQLTRVLQEAEGVQRLHCSTGCWCIDLGIYAGKAKVAGRTPFRKKSNQKCYRKGVQGQGMSMDTGHLWSLGVWWCLNMFGHQITGLRWKLPNDFAGGSFWLCSACCNGLSGHCSIAWSVPKGKGMKRMNKGQLGAWWLFVLGPTNIIFAGLNAEDASNWGWNLIFPTFCDQSKECQGSHEAMTGSFMKCCYCLVRQLVWGSKCSEGWARPRQLQLIWSLFLVDCWASTTFSTEMRRFYSFVETNMDHAECDNSIQKRLLSWLCDCRWITLTRRNSCCSWSRNYKSSL